MSPTFLGPDKPRPNEPVSITRIVTATDPEPLVRTFDGRTDRYAEAARAALTLRREAEAGRGLDHTEDGLNLAELVRHAYSSATNVVLAIAEPDDPRHLQRWERRVHRPAHAFHVDRFEDATVPNPGEPGSIRTCRALMPVRVILESIRSVWNLISEACTDPAIEHVWVAAGRGAIGNIVHRLVHRLSEHDVDKLLERLDERPDAVLVIRNGEILEGYEP